MYEGATVAVVIPAYNEARFVGDVIETVPAFVDRVYVVDDRSTDDTWREIRGTLAGLEGSERPGGPLRPAAGGPEAIAEGSGPIADGSGASANDSGAVADGAGPAWRDRIVARDARSGTALPDRLVIALRHRENTGVGGAIKTGYRNAVADDADVDVVAVMNGDGQMDPAILDRIVAPVVRGDTDYAEGTGKPLRHAEYRRTTDSHSGCTAISRRALDRVAFESLHDDDGFRTHLLVRLNWQGLRVADVPMEAV